MTRSSRTYRPWRLRLRYLRRLLTGSYATAVNYEINTMDLGADINEDRISALEEIVAARWPRSMTVRRRLARQLRASAAGYAAMETDFTRRRSQAVGDELIMRIQRSRRSQP